MITSLARNIALPLLGLLLFPLTTFAMPSLRKFHDKASRHEPVSVVFFGGSLTWGANASDPLLTSYRGRMMEWLRSQYPQTPIAFHDAAIGGSGSQLGMFRLERDVLAHKPDLVFLDFTVNDDAEGKDVQSLASYEEIVRKLLGQESMVVPVLMMFRWHAENAEAPLPARHQAHIQIAGHYGLPYANTIPYVRGKVAAGTDIKTLWPFDGAHPDDPGYELFFEAVRDVYQQGVKEEATASLPEKPLFAALYPKRTRQILVDGKLPEGWTREKTYRTSLWFDGMASRWMGDVACATAASRSGALEVGFEGSMVGIFGERNGLAPAIRVWIDGKPVAPPKAKEGEWLWPMDTSRFSPPKKGSGNLFGWTVLAHDLKDGPHTLRIEPVWEGADKDAELRIESVCSAGR